MFPSKTKIQKFVNTTQKKLCKLGSKNMVRSGKSGFMYYFYLYCGKEETVTTDYDQLSASAQSVA